MPRVDYWSVLEETATVLRDALFETQVVVEEPLQLALEMTPRVGVYLDSRTYPASQPLAAGRVARVELRLSVWAWCGSLELKAAVKARDELIAQIEEALMLNRTLNDRVDTLWLEGGEMPSSQLPDSNGYISGGEVAVHIELRTEV